MGMRCEEAAGEARYDRGLMKREQGTGNEQGRGKRVRGES
jgi:hypothetical protein